MKHFTLATALALMALLVSSAFVSAQNRYAGSTYGGYGSAREAWMDRASRNSGGGY